MTPAPESEATVLEIYITAPLSKILSGVAGEYFVAAELSRHGYIASLTLTNTQGIDVLAAREDASHSVGIQVKTNQGSSKEWLLDKKAELQREPDLFFSTSSSIFRAMMVRRPITSSQATSLRSIASAPIGRTLTLLAAATDRVKTQRCGCSRTQKTRIVTSGRPLGSIAGLPNNG